MEARFLAPLDVRKIPGVGKVMEKSLHALGIRKVGDLAKLDEAFLREKFGKWGLALAGKSHGLDAGGWFDTEIGANEDPKSISHEQTYNTDTADRDQLDATLARLTEMVARRLREHKLWARTVQLKLRYSDFSTFTRAHTLTQPSQLDSELLAEARSLFDRNWTRKPIRLLGVQVSSLERSEGQISLLDQGHSDQWRKALGAVDTLRDRFGETSVTLASSMKGRFRERVHENPVGLPGKKPQDLA
jgi:DNA polymerase-4